VNGKKQEIHLCAECAETFKSRRGFDTGFGFGLGASGFDDLFERMMHPRLHQSRGRVHLTDMLSDAAHKHLETAAHQAAQHGSEDVKPEHLLLSLLDDESVNGVFRKVLGADVETILERLDEVIEVKEALPEPDAIRLSPRLKRVLQLAHDHATKQGHQLVGPEFFVLGLLAEGESLAAQVLAESANVGARPVEHLVDAAYDEQQAPMPKGKKGAKGEQLAKFTRDLTELARQGKLDPVIGREPEIERVVRILSRRTKNNPVLIGEPGVGKTAIAEGLAQRIVAGEVPDTLKDKAVLALDLGGMVAGTKYRGEFEERLKGMMDEIKKQEGEIVLFIDELHTILGAGAAEGAMDAANMLKPALARGELHCIGATTLDEYRKHIEKDAALERRFQPVLVNEPTAEQSIEILRGLKDLYEAHHSVRIADEAVVAAVELSDKYVTDRFLPDKAIDVLDEACAMRHLGSRRQPKQVSELEAERERLEMAKEHAVKEEDYDRARELKGQIDEVEKRLSTMLKGWRGEQGKEEPCVRLEDIAQVVSEWTGIPANKLVAEEKKRLLSMEEHLHKRVIGQEEAIQAVSEAVRRARTGMKDPNRPIGSFIFLGPTGVGKTELAKALAEYLFNDEGAMVRLDMSEYQEKHTVSRLVGAPPGYVGYEEAGQLTEAIRRKPYSVVLFDEIEKAHPDVFNILLQMMDDGRLTDNQGKTVDCKNTVIIMTSNVGAHRIFEFEEQGEDWEAIKSAAMEALKAGFRPEFINRVDEIVVFHPLTKDQILRIVDLMLESTPRKLHAQKLGVEFTDAARAALAEQGFDPTYGARPLRRAIQKQIETPISRLLLEDEFQPGETIRIDAADGKFTFFRVGAEEAPTVSIEKAGEGAEPIIAAGGGGGGGEGAETPDGDTTESSERSQD
jgi:ATP-dependent Clp protease ATP-binding subunit ClpC